MDSLPDDVKNKLASVREEDVPTLSEFEVWDKIVKSKKPKSVVPGDVPKRIVQEFSPELSTPMHRMYTNIYSVQSRPPTS